MSSQKIENPGGSLGDSIFPVAKFETKNQLIEYLKNNRGYDYSNNLTFPNLITGKQIAEMGCGHGLMSIAISEFAKTLDSYDVDEDAILYAKTLARNMKIENINFIRYSDYNTGMPTETYDVVISADVLEHVPEPLRYLRECYRILKKDGILLLTTPNGGIANKNDCIIKSHSPFHITEYTSKELQKMVETIGVSHSEVFSKVNKIGMGYRLTRIQKLKQLFYCKLSEKNRKRAKYFLIKINGSRNLKNNPPDSCDNYSVTKSSFDEINAQNCDVIMIVAKK